MTLILLMVLRPVCAFIQSVMPQRNARQRLSVIFRILLLVKIICSHRFSIWWHKENIYSSHSGCSSRNLSFCNRTASFIILWWWGGDRKWIISFGIISSHSSIPEKRQSFRRGGLKWLQKNNLCDEGGVLPPCPSVQELATEAIIRKIEVSHLCSSGNRLTQKLLLPCICPLQKCFPIERSQGVMWLSVSVIHSISDVSSPNGQYW